MSIPVQSTVQIAVFFLKNFADVVRQARRQEPLTLETAIGFQEGFLQSRANNPVTVMPKQSEDFINQKVANGFTLTGYMRLSDFQAFVPFYEETEFFVANAANQKILREAFSGGQPN